MKNIICPVSGVNIMRFGLTVLAGFVFIFAYDYLVHASFLMPFYEETPQLWLDADTMGDRFWWMILMQILVVKFSAFIFSRNFEGRGIGEGLRFGAMLGALLAVLMMMPYAYMPISMTLALLWGVAEFFRGLGLGLIFALVYRR